MKALPYSTVRSIRDQMVGRAKIRVMRAISCGELPPLTGAVKCTDCDEPAWCYDHRDYRYPLMVEPVCQGCNNRRGPGFPPIEKHDSLEYKDELKPVINDKRSSSKIHGHLEADGEGYTLHDLPFHADASALFPPEEDVDSPHALTMGGYTKMKGWLDRVAGYKGKGNARQEWFKDRDPWALNR